MRKLLGIAILSMLIISTMIAGCTSTPATTDNSTKTTDAGSQGIKKLVVGTTSEVTDLNVGDYYFLILREIYIVPGLIRVSENGSFVPELAESWECADGKRWLVHLQKDAKWHDGTPLTTDDVIFSIDYLKKAELSPTFEWIESMEKIDDHTFIMNLIKPYSNFPTEICDLQVIPKHVFKDVADPLTFNDAKAAIGYGPYKLGSFDRDAGILTLKAFDDYYGEKPAVDEIEFRYFKNQDTMIMALKKGDIDTTYNYASPLKYYYVPGLMQTDRLKIEVQDNLGVPHVLGFNCNKSFPYNNAEFRQAVSYALNYEEMKNLIVGGYGETPNAGLVPAGNPHYAQTRPLTQDVAKAGAMLDSLGIKDTDTDGFRNLPDGGKFQPVITVRQDKVDDVRAAELVKKYLNNVGIDARIDIVDKATYRKAVNTDRSFDLDIFSIDPGIIILHAAYGTWFTDSRETGYTNINNQSFLVLIDEMLGTTDESRRKEIATVFQKTYEADMYGIPLVWSDNIYAYDKKYAGWGYSPIWGPMSIETITDLHLA